ncbi:MAG: hypothetical protein LBC99_00855 [Spirochaetota bacterium]|jgi:hypothetical protein|nr:hypothetical protein [Spirochaetota bacterium]
MRLLHLLIVIVLLAVSVQAAAAVDVAVTGFADTRASYTMGDTDAFGFAFHSSRVIFGARLAPWISSVIQFGTNPGSTEVGLGTATVNLNSVGEGTKMSLAMGRFPVPMGLASGWYLSPNNAFAYQPSVTEFGIGSRNGGWSDVGAMGTMQADMFRLQAYVVQGNMPNTRIIAANNPLNPNKGIAVGARAVFTPIDGLGIGLSYCLNGRQAHAAATDPDPDENNNKSIIAGDISWALGPATLSFEYLAWMPHFTFDERKDVWFAQFEFDLAKVAGIPVTPGVRYDHISGSVLSTAALPDAESGSALTIQAYYKFEKYLRIGLSFRTESGTSATPPDDVITLQVLGMF